MKSYTIVNVYGKRLLVGCCAIGLSVMLNVGCSTSGGTKSNAKVAKADVKPKVNDVKQGDAVVDDEAGKVAAEAEQLAARLEKALAKLREQQAKEAAERSKPNINAEGLKGEGSGKGTITKQDAGEAGK